MADEYESDGIGNAVGSYGAWAFVHIVGRHPSEIMQNVVSLA